MSQLITADIDTSQQPIQKSLRFPITLQTKLLALSPQFWATDDKGRNLGYVKQQPFQFKKHVRIFADKNQQHVRYAIAADHALDFSACYSFYSKKTKAPLGSVRRREKRSLWRISYEVFDEYDQKHNSIHEANALARLLDRCFASIPILGACIGYVFKPSYLIKDQRGQVIMRMQKQPAMWKNIFKIESFQPIAYEDQKRLLLALMMMMLLERLRS